jgi:hypothetical protein
VIAGASVARHVGWLNSRPRVWARGWAFVIALEPLPLVARICRGPIRVLAFWFPLFEDELLATEQELAGIHRRGRFSRRVLPTAGRRDRWVLVGGDVDEVASTQALTPPLPIPGRPRRLEKQPHRTRSITLSDESRDRRNSAAR